MKSPFPQKRLFKLSFLLSLVVSILMVLFFIMAGRKDITVLFRFLESTLFCLMTSWMNIYLQYSLKNKKGLKYKIFLYITSYLGSIVMWLLSKFIILMIGHHYVDNNFAAVRTYYIAILSVWCCNSLILILQQLIIVQQNDVRKEIENISLKANLANASNLLLRQQLQPHFLFNALSTLKSLYKQNNHLAEEYLVHLASFLRESLVNKPEQTVLVKDELSFCANYMNMQEIRFGKAVQYQVCVSDDTVNKKYIPYFSLQPLIENAFKHNDFTEEKPIIIEVLEKNGFIVVTNTLRKRIYPVESTGNGLYNLSERYKLLGATEIEIMTENGLFEVILKLLEH